jgi:hypothetical protein
MLRVLTGVPYRDRCSVSSQVFRIFTIVPLFFAVPVLMFPGSLPQYTTVISFLRFSDSLSCHKYLSTCQGADLTRRDGAERLGRLSPTGGKVDVLDAPFRYGTLTFFLLLSQVKRISTNNCDFPNTIAIGAPGAKKCIDIAACRHHSLGNFLRRRV